MKKIFLFIIVTLYLFINPSYAAQVTNYKYGKGQLKVTENTAHVIEYFFSGGKIGKYAKKQKIGWKPGIMAISIDGREYSYIRHPNHITQIDNTNYAGIVVSKCEKRSGTKCFIFANAYKIVWDNGSDKKKRKLKRKDIKKGKTLQILQELGFYDGGIKKSKIKAIEKSETTINKKITTNSDPDIVKKIKELNKLYKEGVLTKEEFEKAKKKLLN